VIDLDFELPLAPFALEVKATLAEGVTAVMGPSGAGKTSLLEAVAGLRRRSTGRMAVGDACLLDTSRGLNLRPEERRVGYVPQDAGLFPHLSALGNVRFGAAGDPAVVDMAIDTLGIRDVLDRYPETLSGGERQRVALARALATRPRLLLLDEPLAALDPGLKERILPYLKRIREEWGIPMIYVTHNVGEALAIAGQTLLLDRGRVAALGAPLALLSSPVLSREAEAGIENLLQGRILAHDEAGGVSRILLAGGGEVAVPLCSVSPPGAGVTLAFRAEDVLVSSKPLAFVSARNLYEARVLSLERTGVDVTVRCELSHGGAWLARLTPAAVTDLGLGPGRAVWLALKSHSVRVIGSF
jgi:molybdate transport system ATP-binding protein